MGEMPRLRGFVLGDVGGGGGGGGGDGVATLPALKYVKRLDFW